MSASLTLKSICFHDVRSWKLTDDDLKKQLLNFGETESRIFHVYFTLLCVIKNSSNFLSIKVILSALYIS